MKRLFAFASAVFLLALSAKAGLTNAVYWNFGPSAANVPSGSPISNSFSGLTVGSFTQGNNNGTTAPFTTTSASTTYTTAAGFSNTGSTNAGAAVLAGAFNTATSTFFAFSLSLSSSSTLSYSITDISFGSRSTGTGPQSLSLYSSTDGFVSDFTSLGSITALNNSVWAAIDFGSLSLSLPNNDSVLSFRIYGSGVVGIPSAGTATWRVDDVAVTISEVPEPSSIALGLLGGLAGLVWLRRRQ